jgi:hypothetical protein
MGKGEGEKGNGKEWGNTSILNPLPLNPFPFPFCFIQHGGNS